MFDIAVPGQEPWGFQIPANLTLAATNLTNGFLTTQRLLQGTTGLACHLTLNGHKAYLPANVEVQLTEYEKVGIQIAIESRSEQRIVGGYFGAYATGFARELVS